MNFSNMATDGLKDFFFMFMISLIIIFLRDVLMNVPYWKIFHPLSVLQVLYFSVPCWIIAFINLRKNNSVSKYLTYLWLAVVLFFLIPVISAYKISLTANLGFDPLYKDGQITLLGFVNELLKPPFFIALIASIHFAMVSKLKGK